MATVFVETPPVVLTKVDALRGNESIVEPVTLGMLLASDETLMVVGNRLPAIADPTYGESWPASLARRALARGASRRSRFPMVNWVAPSPRSAPAHRAAGVSAAMWVHALEGQSLGLLRGWRDLRDGSASPYASVILDPAQLEAIAHTALDLIRHADSIARFDAMPSLAIALDSDAVDVRDDNAWAKWTLPIWAALANRQIRFDVVRTADRIHDERRSQRYRVVFPLRREQAGDANAIALRIERTMSVQGGYVSGITARGSDGKPARDVYVRSVRATSGPPHIALVNLSDRPRRLKLHGGSNLGVMRDLLTGEPVEKPDELIRLAPWQVRLLGPGSPSKK
ncbi:MAG: hypothetical protein IIB60_05295 [Planctomycetes bacterium]|nr:hypothetical protein [Planctomycetota bacterium]